MRITVKTLLEPWINCGEIQVEMRYGYEMSIAGMSFNIILVRKR